VSQVPPLGVLPLCGGQKGRKVKALAAQLLIYETVVPVSLAKHRTWCLEAGKDYAFCQNLNSAPLMGVEFARAALEYVIVFADTGDTVLPAVILGIRVDENLYVIEQGGWQANYVPAFFRRYPFVFFSQDGSKTFTLCIDDAFPGFNQSGCGERLFGDDGKPTPYLDNVLKFVQQYQLEFQRTRAFCKRLKELNLLEPMQAQMNLSSGEHLALEGFSVVNRARLKTLSAEVLAEMVRSDELELIYNHLASIRNFATLRERAAKAPPRPRAGDA
jgi:hypothetical protein